MAGPFNPPKDFTSIVSDSSLNVSKNKSIVNAKYIKGYASEQSLDVISAAMNLDKNTVKQMFGVKNPQVDQYDPDHTTDAKKEEFWFANNGESLDGKTVLSQNDSDTDTFKKGLKSNSTEGGYGQTDFWYEDPFVPSFEIFFDDESAFFNTKRNVTNSLQYFIGNYGLTLDDNYIKRYNMWKEFQNVFFKIFEKGTERNKNRNRKNKAYYISKVAGLNNLNKKIISFGEDKLTITLNEDVSMIAWYLSELYNNLVYSYKNQRYMFPENVIRFNMDVKINDIRNYQIPQSNNENSPTSNVNINYPNKNIKNVIAPKSNVVYTLHDCTFNFFESSNHLDDIEIGGYNAPSYAPQSLSFEIFYKSVTRYSEFPLINADTSINGWEFLYKSSGENITNGTKQDYNSALSTLSQSAPDQKSYLNSNLSQPLQNVSNQGLNYENNLSSKLRDLKKNTIDSVLNELKKVPAQEKENLDNFLGIAPQNILNQTITFTNSLETQLREERGKVVNGLLSQFRNVTTLNKIEPDNVYQKNFNNRTDLTNFGRKVASGLLNDLENAVKGAANF